MGQRASWVGAVTASRAGNMGPGGHDHDPSEQRAPRNTHIKRDAKIGLEEVLGLLDGGLVLASSMNPVCVCALRFRTHAENHTPSCPGKTRSLAHGNISSAGTY